MSSKKDDLRPEYPPELIKAGDRGNFAERYKKEGTNVVLIDPDLHELFPDSESVNRALREYAGKAQRGAS